MFEDCKFLISEGDLWLSVSEIFCFYCGLCRFFANYDSIMKTLSDRIFFVLRLHTNAKCDEKNQIKLTEIMSRVCCIWCVVAMVIGYSLLGFGACRCILLESLQANGTWEFFLSLIFKSKHKIIWLADLCSWTFVRSCAYLCIGHFSQNSLNLTIWYKKEDWFDGPNCTN